MTRDFKKELRGFDAVWRRVTAAKEEKAELKKPEKQPFPPSRRRRNS